MGSPTAIQIYTVKSAYLHTANVRAYYPYYPEYSIIQTLKIFLKTAHGQAQKWNSIKLVKWDPNPPPLSDWISNANTDIYKR